MSRRALVVGGTGPTGPDVVRGLLERGYDTTIFHGGSHEVSLPSQVRHVHGDPHFPETIVNTLGVSEFDVVIAQYGRLRHLADHFAGRTAHFIAIGGVMSVLADDRDAVWGPMGRPAIVREEARHTRESPAGGTLGFRIAQARRHVLELGAAGAFAATYIAYPTLYGPRQPGSPEWSIVRRLLDGRRRLILPDGGLRIESRAFNRNVAQAPLHAADEPARAAGKSYVVSDLDLYTVRQRVEAIAGIMGAEIEVVSLPYDVATPAHPLYRGGSAHRAGTADQIRDELGLVDRFSTHQALEQTVEWLLGATDEEVNETERQLNDAFDYDFEDRLIQWWRGAMQALPTPRSEPYEYSHIYRHPKQPGESWRPSGSKEQ